MIKTITRDKYPRTCAVFPPPFSPSTSVGVLTLTSVVVSGSVVPCVVGALVSVSVVPCVVGALVVVGAAGALK